MANEPKPTPEALRSTLPLGGKLLKSISDNFTQRPVQGDDSWEICSVGVALNSIVATDTNSAIIVGENADEHVATQRKEALLESARAGLYGDAVRLEDIARNTDDAGEPRLMPEVQAVIRRYLSGMRHLATVSPAALQAIGRVATAAGAGSVELFQPEGDTTELGFRFTFPPDPGHINLFSSWDGDIEARGVFKTVKSFAPARALEDGEPPAEGEEADLAPMRDRRPAKMAPVAESTNEPAVVAQVTVEPEPTVDLANSIERGSYRLPPLSLLELRLSERVETGGHEATILRRLRENNVVGRIVAAHSGPTLTQYELEVPGNVGVKKIAAMEGDLQYALAVRSVRIEAPIPGKKAIGIEVPNPVARMVGLLDLCARAAFVDAEARLTVALGEDVGGRPVYADLATMPHLLLGGATNSGKSIGIASILASLLLRNTPADLRMVLIDPKQVELTLFDRIPHLMCPVVTDVKEAAGILRAVWREMDRRYDTLKERAVRNIAGFNAKASINERLPYIVVVVDELADLLMSAPEVEQAIVHLGQKARAVGIHLVLATQRPSADIVTGLIKANVPSRIAFAVASGVDSKVILDSTGAESLLGRGDMLFKHNEAGKPTRVQGAYVSEDEVDALCRFWREQSQPSYTIATEDGAEAEDGDRYAIGKADELADEVLWKRAVRFAVDKGQCSTSLLQREFAIGFQKAMGILDEMERRKVVGPRDGPRPRTVLMDSEAVEAMLAGGGDGA